MTNDLVDLDGTVVLRARASEDTVPSIRLIDTDNGAIVQVQGHRALLTLLEGLEALLRDKDATDDTPDPEDD